jgi:hypothetical protein
LQKENVLAAYRYGQHIGYLKRIKREGEPSVFILYATAKGTLVNNPEEFKSRITAASIFTGREP